MYERRSILLKTPSYRQETLTHSMRFVIVNYEGNLESSKKRSATLLTFLFLISSTASIHFSAFEASATNNDQDADGLPYGIEFIITHNRRIGIPTMMDSQMAGSGSTASTHYLHWGKTDLLEIQIPMV